MDEDGIDPYAFLDFAHDIDHSGIALNPLLGAAIEQLPGRKLILTNGSRKHAQNVAMKARHLRSFRGRVRHRGRRHVPKPDRRAYERFLDRHAVDPRKAAMFEDIAETSSCRTTST